MTNKLYEVDLFILNINNPYIKLIVLMKQFTNTVVITRFLSFLVLFMSVKYATDKFYTLARLADDSSSSLVFSPGSFP